MNALTEKKQPVKHTFTVTVDIDPEWITFLTQYSDIFGKPHYAGYWLRGVEHDDERGWLCWEDDERHWRDEEPDRDEAIAAWRDGKPLPEHWFRLDRAAALRAWEEGVKLWGTDWYEDADGPRYDVVVQLALLGEERYG